MVRIPNDEFVVIAILLLVVLLLLCLQKTFWSIYERVVVGVEWKSN